MKIRAYDKEEDAIIYSDLIPDKYEFKFASSGDLEVLRHGKKIDAEIDLCSGIFDKNSCEIYQNDIVKFESNEIYITEKQRIVYFDNSGFRAANIGLDLICIIAPDYEIVGNTHTETEV